MNKKFYLFLLLLIGLILLANSWVSSFPISITETEDYVFNHLSYQYWISSAIVIVALYAIALTFENRYLKWLCAIGIVISMYSSSYFFSYLPGSDSQFFRGLTEYFFQTDKLVQTAPVNEYYSWPIFFIFSEILTDITGLGLGLVEFIIYTVIGAIFASTLYVYFSSSSKKNGFVAVAAFFIVMFSFLDYQCVPFALAFSLFLLLIMYEAFSHKTFPSIFLSCLVFFAILCTHMFVPAFYILYKLILFIFNRQKKNLFLFAFAIISYFLYLFFIIPSVFKTNLQLLLYGSSEVPEVIAYSASLSSAPLDKFFQILSRVDIVLTAAVCGIGFFILFITRKTRPTDKALLISGGLYLSAGFVVLLLGSRALPIIFFPVAGGIIYLFESKFGKYFKVFFVILLMMFSFVQLHTSFYNEQTFFQTSETHEAETFLLDHYNWTKEGIVLADFCVVPYLSANVPLSNSLIDYSFYTGINDYDALLYTVGLGNTLLEYNYTTDRIIQEQVFGVIYTNGFSYIGINTQD